MADEIFLTLRRLVKTPITRDQLTAVPMYENVYKVENAALCSYIYWDKFAVFAIEMPDLSYIEFENVYKMADIINEAIRNQDYSRAITLTSDRLRYFLFDLLLDDLSFHKKGYRPPNRVKGVIYDLFIQIYTNMDAGFHLFTPKFIKRMKSYSKHSENRQNRIDKLNEILNKKQGFGVQIYHGEQSPTVKDHYSWTLNYEVAKKFASMGPKPGTIWCSDISRYHFDECYVFDYLEDRGEEEALIYPRPYTNRIVKVPRM